MRRAAREPIGTMKKNLFDWSESSIGLATAKPFSRVEPKSGALRAM
jgi:hypothetical protein